MSSGFIVDAHHHLWDLRHHYYPWLSDRVHTVRYGDYAPIRRDYLPSDFTADIGDLPITKSVHVQAGYDERDPVGETRWLDSVARSGPPGFPTAIVAYADLCAPDLREVLEGHRRFDRVRGIRQMLHAGPAEHYLERSDWQANLGLLPALAFSFDLQIYPRQMPLAATVIASRPDLRVVLDHCGCPLRDDAAWFERWRAGMTALARLPNVSVKLSGFGMFERDWTVESTRPLVAETIELFGPSRCMFASNFPVDRLMKTYRFVWEAFRQLASAYSPDEQRCLFAGTAERTYAI